MVTEDPQNEARKIEHDKPKLDKLKRRKIKHCKQEQ
jgi:hypothetical protein